MSEREILPSCRYCKSTIAVNNGMCSFCLYDYNHGGPGIRRYLDRIEELLQQNAARLHPTQPAPEEER